MPARKCYWFGLFRDGKWWNRCKRCGKTLRAFPFWTYSEEDETCR